MTNSKNTKRALLSSVLAMLEEMERSCAEFQFLGNYAEV